MAKRNPAPIPFEVPKSIEDAIEIDNLRAQVKRLKEDNRELQDYVDYFRPRARLANVIWRLEDERVAERREYEKLDKRFQRACDLLKKTRRELEDAS